MSSNRRELPLRIYVDTSVFGGCFDAQFREESLRFFGLVRRNRIRVLVSSVTFEELALAPESVRGVLAELSPASLEEVPLGDETIELRDAYIRAGVVTRKSREDATHVAAATVSGADAIVSWNFRHIVRLDRMWAYNAINERRGYGRLTIISPREVRIGDEEE
jgi:predicted nucleic acid-binding protein